MNFKLITAALGLEKIEMHSNFFGNNAPVAKLNEEQLTALENALEEKVPANAEEVIALNETISNLNATIETSIADATEMQETVSTAFKMAGLELAEGQTMIEAIAQLGATCKQYGEATTTHSFAASNGEEKPEGNGLIEGFINPKDEHTKFFNKNN